VWTTEYVARCEADISRTNLLAEVKRPNSARCDNPKIDCAIAPYTTSALQQSSNLCGECTSYLTLTVFPVTPGQLTPGRDQTLSIFQTSDNKTFCARLKH